MFHQLHCLGTIRNVIHTLSEGIIHQKDLLSHVEHCLDYVRQALMCAADTTVEWPAFVREDANGTVQSGTDGNGIQHKCRDWDAVVNFALRERSSDVQGLANL